MAESEQVEANIPDDVGIDASGLTKNLDFEKLQAMAEQVFQQVVAWAQSPAFYAQCRLIITAIVFAFLAAKVIGRNFKPRSQPPQPGSMSKWRGFLYRAKGILFSLFTVIFLGAASVLSDATVQQDWLLKLAQGLAVVGIIYSINKQFVSRGAVKKFIKWVIIPIAIMYVFGWLDNVIDHLDSIKLQLGNISLSLYAIARVFILGSILFWLGRISNDTGKEYIRKQENLEAGIPRSVCQVI